MPSDSITRPINQERRLAALVVLLITLLGLFAPGAHAATLPDVPPGDPTVNSWALAPTGVDPAEPSSRIYLSYDVAPGATLQDSVTLWNYSNVQLTFHVYATDAFNNTDGAFELLTGDAKPVDVGAWVALPQANVTAPAQSKIDLPFTLTVPPDARPGDHAAAVLAASEVEGTGPDGKIVRLDRRTGSRVYVRVAGPVQPALALENVHTVYHPALNPLGGSLDVSYTVRNTGNVRLGAHQRIDVSGPLGVRLARHAPGDVPELLPGNALTLEEHFDGIAALVRVSASVRLEPTPAAGVSDVQTTAVVRTGRTWALPWSVIALLAGLWLARKVLRALRRRKQARAGVNVGVARRPEPELTRAP